MDLRHTAGTHVQKIEMCLQQCQVPVKLSVPMSNQQWKAKNPMHLTSKQVVLLISQYPDPRLGFEGVGQVFLRCHWAQGGAERTAPVIRRAFITPVSLLCFGNKTLHVRVLRVQADRAASDLAFSDSLVVFREVCTIDDALNSPRSH